MPSAVIDSIATARGLMQDAAEAIEQGDSRAARRDFEQAAKLLKGAIANVRRLEVVEQGRCIDPLEDAVDALSAALSGAVEALRRDDA